MSEMEARLEMAQTPPDPFQVQARPMWSIDLARAPDSGFFPASCPQSRPEPRLAVLRLRHTSPPRHPVQGPVGSSGSNTPAGNIGKSLIFAVIVMTLDVMQMELPLSAVQFLPVINDHNILLISSPCMEWKSEEKFMERSPISQLPRGGPHVRTWSNEIYMLLSSGNRSE
ncbi:unnamed protein product [Musa acuminata subsp. burmannicoides]